MTRIQEKELSQKISEVLRNVEHGERYVVTKEGIEVAEIVPVPGNKNREGWKHTLKKATLTPGQTIQQIVEEEREEN